MAKFKLPFLLLCLAAAVAFPLVDTNPSDTTIGVFTLVFAAAGTAWNIFSGYTGYIALGHAVYFGIGAYMMALFCQWWKVPAGWPPFAIAPLGGVIAALFAVPLGALALRTRRHTFVVITIAMLFVFQLLAYNLHQLTGGSSGLTLPIPLWSGNLYNLPFYYLLLVVLVAALLVSWWVRSSKYGLELLAIRDDEDRARGLGVHAGSVKLSAFVLSAFFVGLVGAIWAYFLESIYPPFAFSAQFDVTIALMAFLGGLGTLSGPIIGALVIIPAQQELALQFGVNGLYLILFGAVFLVVILVLPQGIVPGIASLLARRRVTDSEGPVASSPPDTAAPQRVVAVENR